MKKLLCKFANWILKRCLNQNMTFDENVYINGKTYKLVKATAEMSPHQYSIINFEVIDGYVDGNVGG